jgi:hypothetical protein
MQNIILLTKLWKQETQWTGDEHEHEQEQKSQKIFLNVLPLPHDLKTKACLFTKLEWKYNH